jgi:hypothetical protein
VLFLDSQLKLTAMKKILLTTTLICSIIISAYGQLQIGLQAGFNYTTFGGPDVKTWGEMDVNPTWKPGFHLGGLITYDEFLPIVLEAGLYYSMKGCKYKGEMYDYEGGTGMTYNLVRIKDLKYIDLPLLARYYINENLSVFAGPEFAFLLSAKVRDKPEGGETEVIDVMDEYKGFDFLVALGLAYMLNNGLQIQLQYDHGLSNISDYGNGGESYYTIKNRVLKLSLAIMLSKLTGGSKD